ncbi:MAG TPA: SRPBCC domain-containing protein [Bacteroidia bacterium]|nr:SRPBCC domain-containing protein [Bacteroidia bacterium]HNS12305.1 SRPBCC domain-containing protein [Bacteroidia bacterium]
MENFDWTCFTRRIAIKSDIHKLYKAWTCTDEIEKWFLSKAKFFSSEGSELKTSELFTSGCAYEWSWYLYSEIERGKIIHANAKDLIRFSFAGDCLVEVKLIQKNDLVIVELRQSNIPTDDRSKRGIRLGCESGWSFFLLNLKSVYEHGVDLRNKNPELQGMINN